MEEFLLVAHVEAGAVVADEEDAAAGGVLEGANLDAREGDARGVFDSIGNEVGPDLAQDAGVAADGREGMNDPFDGAGAGVEGGLGGQLADEGVEVHGIEADLLLGEAGKIEEAVN